MCNGQCAIEFTASTRAEIVGILATHEPPCASRTGVGLVALRPAAPRAAAPRRPSGPERAFAAKSAPAAQAGRSVAARRTPPPTGSWAQLTSDCWGCSHPMNFPAATQRFEPGSGVLGTSRRAGLQLFLLLLLTLLAATPLGAQPAPKADFPLARVGATRDHRRARRQRREPRRPTANPLQRRPRSLGDERDCSSRRAGDEIVGAS